MKKTILILSILLIINVLSAEITVDEIIDSIDKLYRSNTSKGEIEMVITTPHWERTLKFNIWSEGMDKTFVLVTSPQKEEGYATLRVENEMWNYLPPTDQVMKVPPSMMMGSWMGSDFTNDDLVKESSLFDDYNIEFTQVENPEEDQLYIELIPKENSPVVWGKIIIAVTENNYLPVWQKYYDEDNTLMRIMNFKEIKTFGDKIIPSVLELIPQNNEGNKTVVRYLSMEFNIELDDDIFTLRNLQNQ